MIIDFGSSIVPALSGLYLTECGVKDRLSSLTDYC